MKNLFPVSLLLPKEIPSLPHRRAAETFPERAGSAPRGRVPRSAALRGGAPRRTPRTREMNPPVRPRRRRPKRRSLRKRWSAARGRRPCLATCPANGLLPFPLRRPPLRLLRSPRGWFRPRPHPFLRAMPIAGDRGIPFPYRPPRPVRHRSPDRPLLLAGPRCPDLFLRPVRRRNPPPAASRRTPMLQVRMRRDRMGTDSGALRGRTTGAGISGATAFSVRTVQWGVTTATFGASPAADTPATVPSVRTSAAFPVMSCAA